MKKKLYGLLLNKHKSIPVLSFPAAQLLGVSVRELLSSAEMQAKGMCAVAGKCDIGVSVSMMDLSVEAEAFGAKIRFYDDDVPVTEKGIITDITQAADIIVPSVGEGRCGICIDSIKQAKKKITDIPVFCSVIGPYSLAGRLYDMTELMMDCFDSPDEVKILLSKATEFIIGYIKAFKEAGADGVILAEPAAGLLSPILAEEFSMPFVQRIFNETDSEDFILCYHNCGDSANDMLDMIAELDADIIHLGNAIDMKKALETIPQKKAVAGNIDPLLFRNGTPEEIESELQRIYDECSAYGNFIMSSGCDIPAASKWENIEAYFNKIKQLYK